MRKVVSESEVAHFWANQTQDEARKSNGSFYFEGRTIYSYGRHFPIAVISKKDPHTVFFTTQTWGPTTAGHMHSASSAVSHKNLIHCNDPICADEGLHNKNIRDFEDKAHNIANSLPTSRKPEIYLQKIAEQRRLFTKYCEHFKLNIDKTAKKYGLVYLFIQSKEGGTEATAKELKALEKARKLREAFEKREDKRNEKMWRSFHPESSYNRNGASVHLRNNPHTLLRLNTDTQKIETSKGVTIPVKVAERFYNWLKRTLKAGGCDGNCNHKILDYTVSAVNAEGFKIGCHSITWIEADAMAKQLNWIK